MPRAGLTPAIVVAEAGRIADEVGLDRLTLAAVAQRLGVTLPSLYKHVRGLDGLAQQLAIQALDEFTARGTDATLGLAGQAAMRALAGAYRDYAQSHPGTYAATLRAPDPTDPAHVAAAERAVRVIYAVLAGYGLSGDRAIDAARALRSALHGFVTLEAAHGFGLPRDLDRSYELLVDALDRAFRTWPEG
ncbi:TetR family transcriptional regulator [Micromonospora pisi]|uniref:TetR family transcriptional regulator n=1 Tax=Micromonospora pisi TaxID=589240 RepID=A0A495JL10_9ACTN|nr:TetR/AcrR family transcriptional regulator [Micromonospora pisi]RKR89248.1 TetR family transcriptional regulator [Micromonospora pisi]